jgi:zinc protease
VILREIAMTRDDPDNRLWEGPSSRRRSGSTPTASRHRAQGRLRRRRPERPRRLLPRALRAEQHRGRDRGRRGATEARAAVERHFGAAPRSRLAPVLVPPSRSSSGPAASTATRRSRSSRAALAWPIPGSRIPRRPSSTSWRWCSAAATARSSGRRSGRSASSSTRSTPRAGTRARAGSSASRSRATPGGARGGRGRDHGVLASLAAPGAFTRAGPQGLPPVGRRGDQLLQDDERPGLAPRDGRGRRRRPRVQPHLFRAPGRRWGRRTSAGRSRRTWCRAASSRSRSSPSPRPGAAAGAPRPPGRAPTSRRSPAPNGARLVFQQDRRLPNLHMRLLTHGGPLSEAPDAGQLALLATLLTKDTRRRSAAEVARGSRRWAAPSARSRATTPRDRGEVLPADAELALGLIAEGCSSPPSGRDAHGRARRPARRRCARRMTTSSPFARRLLRPKFFGTPPVRRQGPRATRRASRPRRAGGRLGALEAALVGARRRASRSRATSSRGKLVPKLKAFLSRIPGKPLGAGPFVGPAEPGDLVEKQPREQAVVLQGFPGAVIDAPDFYAARSPTSSSAGWRRGSSSA